MVLPIEGLSGGGREITTTPFTGWGASSESMSKKKLRIRRDCNTGKGAPGVLLFSFNLHST